MRFACRFNLTSAICNFELCSDFSGILMQQKKTERTIVIQLLQKKTENKLIDRKLILYITCILDIV